MKKKYFLLCFTSREVEGIKIVCSVASAFNVKFLVKNLLN